MTRKAWTPRKTESDKHRAMVQALLDAGASAGGFRRAVETAVGAVFDAAPRIVPDAYAINPLTKSVAIYEVCVAHWITRRKRAAVVSWLEWLDPFGWSIRLVKIEERGYVGIDPYDGYPDAESVQLVADRLSGRAE